MQGKKKKLTLIVSINLVSSDAADRGAAGEAGATSYKSRGGNDLGSRPHACQLALLVLFTTVFHPANTYRVSPMARHWGSTDRQEESILRDASWGFAAMATLTQSIMAEHKVLSLRSRVRESFPKEVDDPSLHTVPSACGTQASPAQKEPICHVSTGPKSDCLEPDTVPPNRCSGHFCGINSEWDNAYPLS